MRAFGMQEDTQPVGSRARSFVKQHRSGGAQIGQRLDDVWYFEADMVQATATLRQEARDARRLIGRFEEFNLAAIWAAQRQKRDLYPLAREVNHTRGVNAKYVTIEAKRGLHIAHDDRDVIDSLDGLCQHSAPPFPLLLLPMSVSCSIM